MHTASPATPGTPDFHLPIGNERSEIGNLSMRFIIVHKADQRSEQGIAPEKELVGRVGQMIGRMSRAKVLEAGEGLGPTSRGVRVRFRGGRREVVAGPFTGEHELPASLSMLRTHTLEEAVEWAASQAQALGDIDVDIRPVVEAWDLGFNEKPAGLDTTRYMVVRKADASTEAGADVEPRRRAAFTALIDDSTRAGLHIATETVRPSARGRRYLNTSDGINVYDGPFIESKELLGGYVIVTGASLDAVDHWVREYIEAVGPREVDLLELE